jgi:arabinan endo-1,5-alpha-L-arabinosidase
MDRPGHCDFNAIDPAVTRDADGNLWLAFGSFWSGIKLIQLDPTTGRRIAPDSPVHSLARYQSIEAACILVRDGLYYLFMNWGECCRGTNSTYQIRVGRSARITGPYTDRKGIDLLRDGGELFLGTEGNFIGPGHAGFITDKGLEWVSFHYYDGARGGMPALAVRKLKWDAGGWPQVEDRKTP